MDCYLVHIYWLKEVFGGNGIVKFDIKPTDGTTIFANLGKGGIKFWGVLTADFNNLVESTVKTSPEKK